MFPASASAGVLYLYADEISAQPDDKRHNGDGENKEEKHNPTLITGEDFAALTFIVRRFSFPRYVLLSRASVDEARGRSSSDNRTLAPKSDHQILQFIQPHSRLPRLSISVSCCLHAKPQRIWRLESH
jgi:hypothetical protein